MGDATPKISLDLWQNILLHLDDNYSQIQLVCSSWRNIIKQPIFWKLRSLKKWGDDIAPNKIEASANTTGVLNYDKNRYFFPTVTGSNGRTKIDWPRYYIIREKIEWITNNVGVEEPLNESVELDLHTFNLAEFLTEVLPPGETGYDREMNIAIYLLLDLIEMVLTNPNKKLWYQLTSKVDSWMHVFVVDSPVRMLEAFWRLGKSTSEKGDDNAKKSAFSLLHVFCYSIHDFNPRVQQVLKEVIAHMINEGQDDPEAIVVMRTLFPLAFEKQNRKQNEKGYLDFHDVVYALASEMFYNSNSTASVRENALSALLVTGFPMIPDYIHRSVNLLIEGMKSTEQNVVQRSFELLWNLVKKDHKLTAEQTRTIVELAIQRETDMGVVPEYICYAISKDTSHVIDDKQLDWLNRIKQLENADDLYFVSNNSLRKLRMAFGGRMDKYVPLYKTILLNRGYWNIVKKKDDKFAPQTLVHKYLTLIEPQNGEELSTEFKEILNAVMHLDFNTADLIFNYFPMVNQVFPCDKDENLTMWGNFIEGILSMFSDEMISYGSEASLLDTLDNDNKHEYSQENILLLENAVRNRSKTDQEVIERVLQVRSFQANKDLIPLNQNTDEAVDWGSLQQEVHDNVAIFVPGIVVLIKLAKQMKRKFDPYLYETMHACTGIASFFTKLRSTDSCYKPIGEFFSENFVPVASEEYSIRMASRYLQALSLDCEERGVLKSDIFLEGVQSLTENLFASVMMNSKVTPSILASIFRELGSWPTDRVPILIDTLIVTRPSLAYKTLSRVQTTLYGFAAWIEAFGDGEIALKTYVIIAARFGIRFTNCFRTKVEQDRKYSLEETRTMCLELRKKSTDNYMIKLLNKLIILLSCCLVNKAIEKFNQIKLQLDLHNESDEDKSRHLKALMRQAKYGALIEEALKSNQFDTTCTELNELVDKSNKSFAFFLNLDNK